MEFGCHKKFHLKFFLCGGRLYTKKSNMPGKYKYMMTREERSRKQKFNTLLIYLQKEKIESNVFKG
jgi:hypothetical protein